MDQLQWGPRELGDLHPARAPRVTARAEIARLRASGLGPSAIARSLNARGYPTPSGRGQWWEGTVRRHGDPFVAERWRAYMARYRAARAAPLR